MVVGGRPTLLSHDLDLTPRQTPALPPPSAPRTYHLQILQQPVTGAEHDPYVLSPLPLTPPLILRLRVSNSNGVQIAM